MKKLIATLLSLLCCAALALPVYADVAVGPADYLDSPALLILIVIIGLVLPAVGFLIYWLLRGKRK